MTLLCTRQSKCVRRPDTEPSFSFIDDNHQEEEDNIIKCSNVLNLPTQSYKTAEYLGMRSGYPVCREKSPQKQNTKTAKKKKYDCPVFENEAPVEPFCSLPHPNELFGKRARSENKKKRIKINPVDNHIMQLHQKRDKLHVLAVREVKKKYVQDSYNDTSQGCSITDSLWDSHSIADAAPVSQHSSFQGSNFNDSANQLLGYSFSKYPSFTQHYGEKENSQPRVSFRFNYSKSFEE